MHLTHSQHGSHCLQAKAMEAATMHMHAVLAGHRSTSVQLLLRTRCRRL